MSKNQQKTTFNTSAGMLNSLEGNASNTLNTATGQGATAGSAYSTAENAYAGLGPAGVSNILQPATNAAQGILATGGYAQPQLNTLESQEATNLGGLDPSALNALSGQYQDLISSGGISDATAAAMQRQATSGVGSVYGTLENQLKRTQAATGGQGGGGEIAQMARQLSSQEANAVTGVNAQVGQLRQQGTEVGLAGASNLAASQAAAQNAAANTFSGTQSGVAQGSQYGAGLQSNLGQAALSGNLASAGGLANVAGGETGLYGTTAGLYGQQLGGEQGLLGAEGNIANNMKGPFGNYLQYVNTMANAAGAMAGVGG